MSNSPRVKSVCLILMLSMSQMLVAEEQHEEKPSKFDYYGTHLITGGIAQAASIATMIGGGFIGAPLGLVAKENRCALPVSIGIAMAPFCISVLAGVAVMYKTPQWTDTHILQLVRERSRKQNILIFLSRQCIVYPFGICIGEYLLNRRQCAYTRRTNDGTVSQNLKQDTH